MDWEAVKQEPAGRLFNKLHSPRQMSLPSPTMQLTNSIHLHICEAHVALQMSRGDGCRGIRACLVSERPRPA